MRAAIDEHPRIRFIGGTWAMGAELDGSGVSIELGRGERRERRRFAAAVNCLWSGQLALDAQLGLRPERPWLFRYKAVARLEDPRLSGLALLSATLVHGPFGDVVNYDDGRFYLSWYPSFKLAETTDLDGSHLDECLEGLDRQELARGGVRAMARYLPALERLLESARPFDVTGGVIFSWGSTDIDDPGSGLHERWRIGPRQHGRYVTLDTGKYTMAPLFALETREIVEGLLA